VQKEVAKSDGQILQSARAVTEGLELATELRQSFANISAAVADVYQHAREIGDATQQQSSGSSQIAQATSHLNQLTQEMSSSIEQQAVATKQVVSTMDNLLAGSREISSSSNQLAVSADQMSRMSQQLLRLMERFHIPGSNENLPENPRELAGLRERTLASRSPRRTARALASQS
jgi:methyl-accepting chemotaxis protein